MCAHYSTNSYDVACAVMKIGLTSTIPVEVIFAAGEVPVDLNNLFIGGHNPGECIAHAEEAGFPATVCSWVKGIYNVVVRDGFEKVVVVVEGDCSNNRKLADLLLARGVDVFCFSYPYEGDARFLTKELARMQEWLGASDAKLAMVREQLREVRSCLAELDRLSYETLTVSGFENHYWLVSASDFGGDIERFCSDLKTFLNEAKKRSTRYDRHVRLGYVGVPPIVSDIYAFAEDKGGIVVFNEVQRQFAMLHEADTLCDQYGRYTYPYGLQGRIDDINQAIRERKLDGIIHYVQSFCSHSLDDILLRQKLDIPMVTIECDLPGKLDGKNKIKIEAFLERWL